MTKPWARILAEEAGVDVNTIYKLAKVLKKCDET